MLRDKYMDGKRPIRSEGTDILDKEFQKTLKMKGNSENVKRL